MVKTGTRVKYSTLKQQREAAELELIIEEFGRAMRNAHRPYVVERNDFTEHMKRAWALYVEFCARYPL